MYTQQKNPAALRSQELICRALCTLMRELPFADITVTRICQEAGVGRKTFYRNFDRKEDVVELMVDHLGTEYERELNIVPLEAAAHHHFAFLSRRIEFLTLLNEAGMIPILTERFSRIQPELMPRWSDDEAENAYRTAAVVAGTEAVIRLWAQRGFRESVPELAALYRYALGE